eukprot:2317485-Amphidinium_carterae.1
MQYVCSQVPSTYLLLWFPFLGSVDQHRLKRQDAKCYAIRTKRFVSIPPTFPQNRDTYGGIHITYSALKDWKR